MCGIFGLVTNNKKRFSKKEFKKLIDNLFIFSATRGKEAAGIAFQNEDNIDILKESGTPNQFIKKNSYIELLEKIFNQSKDNNISLIGHSRLVTNGLTSQSYNNQPVIVPKIVGVHNGIITNDEELWKTNLDLERDYVVDTEIMLKLLNKHIQREGSLYKATSNCFSEFLHKFDISWNIITIKCICFAIFLYIIQTMNGCSNI